MILVVAVAATVFKDFEAIVMLVVVIAHVIGLTTMAIRTDNNNNHDKNNNNDNKNDDDSVLVPLDVISVVICLSVCVCLSACVESIFLMSVWYLACVI